MATQYLIEPNPVWAFLDQDGLPAAGGFIYTYEADNHATPKATYQDPNGDTPWSNPITLDSTGKQSFLGTCFPIFWANDSEYYIVITDSDNNEIFAGSGFPWTGSSTPIVTETDIENYFVNSQYYYNYGKIIDDSGDIGFNNLDSSALVIAPDSWFFIKNNSSATDTITFVPFDPGETLVPNNPKSYVLYSCTVPGAAETLKNIYYRFGSVRQFSGTTLNIQFYAKTTLSSQLALSYTQFFGSGGSTTNVQPIATRTLTTNWTLYQFSFTVDSIASENIGANGDDYFAVNFGLPLNTVANVAIANSSLRFGSVFVSIQEESVNITNQQINAANLPSYSTVNWADGNYEFRLLQNAGSSPLIEFIPLAGKMVECATNYPLAGTLLTDGSSVTTAQHYNLGQALYDINALKLPWGTGPSGFTVNDVGAVLTVTCYSNGGVSSGSAATSGFTYVQTDNGSGGSQAIATITAIAAASIAPGSYLLINAPGLSYYMWFALDNTTTDPGSYVTALSGLTGIKVIYVGTENASAMAALCAIQFEIANYLLPTIVSLFKRSWCGGSLTNDPDANSRTAIISGGATGNNVGSFQDDQFKSHTHVQNATDQGGGVSTNVTQGITTGSDPNRFPTLSITGATGGNQTNGKNVYVNTCIYY